MYVNTGVKCVVNLSVELIEFAKRTVTNAVLCVLD